MQFDESNGIICSYVVRVARNSLKLEGEIWCSLNLHIYLFFLWSWRRKPIPRWIEIREKFELIIRVKRCGWIKRSYANISCFKGKPIGF